MRPGPSLVGTGAVRRRLLAAAAALSCAVPPFVLAQPAPAPAAAGAKVLRYAFEVAETGFDPAKINDLYSRTITPHIFEAPYKFDHLARPVKIKPLTADGMPQVSADFRTWTVKIRPGIYFADDEAFKGRRRELVAADYVYTLKRAADPANRSPSWATLEQEKLVGLGALRQKALDQKKPFDYDTPIEGLRALDRYTFQIRLEEPRPRFIEGALSASDLFGAVAREVVEHYGQQLDAHPVGTGPFRLAQWRRSSLIVLERNPGFREMVYDGEPAADDAEGQALAARFKGRRLPMIDRVEVSIIEEEQPRWLAFLTGESDLAWRVGYQFVDTAMPNGKVAPNLARQGIRGHRIVEPAHNYLFFNMEDATVGGYAPHNIALRRAISLGMDTRAEIAYAYNGQATPAQSPYWPDTSGYSPTFKSEFSEYDPARAKALLDMYGWVDRDGDGWRDMPDGAPLVLHMAAQSDQRSRKINELFDKNMRALGVRCEFHVAQWPENLKSARAGKLSMWTLGGYASGPDGGDSLTSYHSAQVGGQNFARFKLPAFDALFEKTLVLPDGPERETLFVAATKLAIAYMPYKYKLDRISTDMTQPWLVGYRRPVFWGEWWQYVDIDEAKRAGAKR